MSVQREPAGVVGNRVTVRMMGADQDLLEEGEEIPLVPRAWGPLQPPHWITQVVGPLTS